MIAVLHLPGLPIRLLVLACRGNYHPRGNGALLVGLIANRSAGITGCAPPGHLIASYRHISQFHVVFLAKLRFSLYGKVVG